jgi:hypothetical protein
MKWVLYLTLWLNGEPTTKRETSHVFDSEIECVRAAEKRSRMLNNAAMNGAHFVMHCEEKKE